MTVDTGQARLLMHVTGKLAVFNTIGTGRLTAVRLVGGPVIPMEVMLEATIIVGTDKVAVVAMEALLVRGAAHKGVALQAAAAILQVAGGTAHAAQGLCVVVAVIADVTAQTAAAQQVVQQFQGRGRRFGDRNIVGPFQVMLGTEGAAQRVDLVGVGEMQGGVAAAHLFGMAGAATCCHEVRVGRAAHQIGVGLLGRGADVLAAMTGGAGQGMMLIKLVRVTILTGEAAGLRLALGSGWRRRFLLFLFVPGAARYKEEEKRGGK